MSDDGKVFIEGGWKTPDELAAALDGCWFPIALIGDRQLALVGAPGESAIEAERLENGHWVCDCGVLDPAPTHFIPYPRASDGL